LLLYAFLVACRGGEPAEPDDDDGVGLLGDGLADPFPSSLLVQEGHLALSPDDLAEGGATPLRLDTLSWRTGFSPAQVAVVNLPGIDPASLPDWRAPTPGVGGVILADLTAGELLPVFAELDAWPGQDDPRLLIRPLQAVPVGHVAAIAVTTSAVARPPRFDALIDGTPPASLASQADHFRAVVDGLVALGLDRDDIALAWDYPVGDGTQPLRSALAQHQVPGTWTFDSIRSADAGDPVAGPLTWRAAEGSYAVTSFLVDDLLLDLDDTGSARPTGTAEAYVYVHVPTSVKDDPAGTVPVMVFGHGIFGAPDSYLDDAGDPDGLLALADEGHFIVVATKWRGLTLEDTADALGVAGDFAQIDEIPSRLVQAQVNNRTLLDLVRAGSFTQDDVFRGAQGQLLVDPTRVFYYGISLGGIEGQVFLANDPPVEAGVCHVAGAMWSTMLERSSDWPLFEQLLVKAVPQPADRQQLYALSQLWWDEVDPIDYAADLATRPYLMQISVGDEQVPNLTSEAMARSVGLPELEPAVDAPFGLTQVPNPLPEGSAAFVEYDPEVPLPPDGNRPAPVTGAHQAPRRWVGTRAQTLDYLLGGRAVVHHCGEAPCSASNQGNE
jgi:hypothetical protein